MRVLSTLLAAVVALAVVQGDSIVASVTGTISSYASGAHSVCLDSSGCFPVRALNDTSEIKRLALASQTHHVDPQARYLCFDAALEHCVVEDTTKAVQVERGGQLESIGCIFVPWGMLCNGMN